MSVQSNVDTMASAHCSLLFTAAAVMLLVSSNPTFAWVPTLNNNIMHPSATDAYYSRTTQLTAEQGDDDTSDAKYNGYNVLGTELSCCCSSVRDSGIGTGFYR